MQRTGASVGLGAALAGVLAASAQSPAHAADGPKALRIEVPEGIASDVLLDETSDCAYAIDGQRNARAWRLADGSEALRLPLPSNWIEATFVAGGSGLLGVRDDGAIEYAPALAGGAPRVVVAPDPEIAWQRPHIMVSDAGERVFVSQSIVGDAQAERRSQGLPVQRSFLVRAVVGADPAVVRSFVDSHLRIAFAAGAAPVALTLVGDGQLLVLDDEGRGTASLRVSSPLPALFCIAASHEARWFAADGGLGVVVGDLTTGHVVRCLDSWLDAGPPPAEASPGVQRSIAFLPGTGVLAATELGRRTVRLWDVARGHVLRDLEARDEQLAGLSVSLRARLVAGIALRALTVWRVDPSSLPRPPAERDPDALPEGVVARVGASPWRTSGSVTSLVFAADGRSFWYGTSAGVVGARSTSDATSIWTTQLDSGVSRMVATRDGRTLVCARPHGRAVVLDAVTGQVRDEIPHDDVLGGNAGQTCVLALSDDDKRVALAGYDGVAVWDLAASKGVAFMPGRRMDFEGLRDFPVPPVGLYFMSGTRESAVVAVWHDRFQRTLSVNGGGCQDQEVRASEPIATFDVQLDRRTVLAARPDGVALLSTLGDPRTQSIECPLPRGYRLGSVIGSATHRPQLLLRPGSKELWLADASGALNVFALDTKANSVVGPVGGGITAIACSADGGVVLTGCVDGTLRRFDAATRAPGPVTAGPAGELTCLAYAPDGAALAAGGLWGDIAIWPTRESSETRTLACNGRMVTALAWSPRGRRLVAALANPDDPSDGEVVVWDTKTWERVFGQAGDPIVRGIAVADVSGSVFVLRRRGIERLRKDGAKPIPVRGADESDAPSTLALSPDGRELVVTIGATVLVVDADSGATHSELSVPAVAAGAPPTSCANAALAVGGREVVGVLDDGSVIRWSRETRQVLARGAPTVRHCSSALIGASGAAVVVLRRPGEPLVRRVSDDRLLRVVDVPETGGMSELVCALSADGTELAVGEPGCSVLRWRLTE